MNKTLIHTPEGVRDIYGSEYLKKNAAEETISSVIRSFGYRQIQTPTFEFFDVFGNEVGTTPSRELYKFFDKDGNTLVLRPDFTPSMARCAAKYFMEETFPVRFFYRGNTFINNSLLQGKLKEATQIGAELIQDSSVAADAEVIAMTVAALQAAGLKEFQISVGHVDYFRGICEKAGMSSEIESDIRDLISGKNYFGAQEYLESTQVDSEVCEKILKVYDLSGGVEILSEAKALVAGNDKALSAVERLENLYQVLCIMGVEKYISFDLGLLSKYHYYTGIVYKAYTYGVGDAIAKGGRYDNLIGRFGKNAPAVGFVILVDDLLEALRRQGNQPDKKQGGVLIVGNPAYMETSVSAAFTYRQYGISAELIWQEEPDVEHLKAKAAEDGRERLVIIRGAEDVETISVDESEEEQV